MFGTDSLFLGWFSMVVAVVGFGFCTTPIKLDFVQKAKVDPMLFQIFYSITIFLFCIPPLAYTTRDFSYWGMIGAVCWVPGSVLSIFGIRFLGLSISQGLWSVGSMIVGFLWGIIYFKQEVPNIYLCIVGIVFLCSGVFVLATADLDFDLWGVFYSCCCCRCFCVRLFLDGKDISKKSRLSLTRKTGNLNILETDDPEINSDEEISVTNERSSLIHHESEEKRSRENQVNPYDDDEYIPIIGLENDNSRIRNDNNLISSRNGPKEIIINKVEYEDHDSPINPDIKKQEGRNWCNYIIGLVCVALFALLNGSMMVPSNIDSHDELYLFEFGVGVLFVTPFVSTIYFITKSLLTSQPSFRLTEIKAATIPGLTSGILWSFGNYGTLFAILSPIGLAIAVPLSQTALVISGLSGMILFGELKGLRKKVQFFVATLFLILPGCFLLAIFGTGENKVKS